MPGCQQLPIGRQRVTFTAHLEKQLVLSGEFCTWLQSRWEVSGVCTPLLPALRKQKQEGGQPAWSTEPIPGQARLHNETLTPSSLSSHTSPTHKKT